MGKTKAREDLLIVDEFQVDLLKIDSVEVTASAAELNILDGATLSVEELNILDGVTLANPTATTDDFKRLSIRSLTAQAHTVTVTGGFGNGSTGEDVATFSGAIGDGIELMAYQGYWYITGAHQVAVA